MFSGRHLDLVNGHPRTTKKMEEASNAYNIPTTAFPELCLDLELPQCGLMRFVLGSLTVGGNDIRISTVLYRRVVRFNEAYRKKDLGSLAGLY
jgi:hypothetical protein